MRVQYSALPHEKLFAICRNDKPIKTPAGCAFVVPTQTLADAIAAEWSAQDEKKINPLVMPLTQLAATALDVIPKERAKITAQLASYAGSELLCHRADKPDDLVQLQHKTWQPLLDWCASRFGAALCVGQGVMPLVQNGAALFALQCAVEAHDDFKLVALSDAVEVTGSLVLGLALAERQLNAEETFRAAELDSEYQIARWGEDAEAVKRRAAIRRVLEADEQWFAALV